MCGICLILLSSDEGISEEHRIKIECDLKNSPLCCRGPDIQNTTEKILSPSCHGVFYGSTLHFRGQFTAQPLQDQDNNILLWNGEIFGGLDVSPDENDGEVLMNKLVFCNTDEEVLQLFSKIKGPWAFIYWKASSNQLWFGRDVFGRRSLLYHKDANNFALSSVAIKEWKPWQEVPALGIYCAAVDDCFGTCSAKSIILYPWGTFSTLDIEGGIKSAANWQTWNEFLMAQSTSVLDDIGVELLHATFVPQIKPFNNSIPQPDPLVSVVAAQSLESIASDHQKELADEFIHVLQDAVRIRTSCQSNKCSQCIRKHVASLSKTDFCHFANAQRKANSLNPQTHETDASPSSVCAAIKHSTLCDDILCPDDSFTVANSDNSDPVVKTSEQTSGKQACSTLSHCGHARVAILFSGGIDSLLIAALADRCVPEDEPIDLLNVAFEQNVTARVQKASQMDRLDRQGFAVPDRKTGLSGVEELTSLNPNRTWNFVQIDITLNELQRLRSESVKNLVYPLCTVLDDSIGCALWFASRGQGVIHTKYGQVTPYKSPARVVLVGMGADEQLVGYSRHRAKYSFSGWPGLVEEIQMEIQRISSRNLGRDDRVISDSSREARFPFLDENVVSFLNQLPLHEKANLDLPKGIGDKFLLRLAAERIGLKQGATIPKRAIQFGSKIAKAENNKEKGSDNCYRLQE